MLLKSPASLAVREVLQSVLLAGVPPESLGLGRVEPTLAEAVARALAGGPDNAAGGSETVEDLIRRTTAQA